MYIYIYREREIYTYIPSYMYLRLYRRFICLVHFAPRGQGSLSRNGQTVSFGAASAASDGSPSSTTSPKGAELVINDLSLSLSISLSLSLSLYIYIYIYTHVYVYIDRYV